MVHAMGATVSFLLHFLPGVQNGLTPNPPLPTDVVLHVGFCHTASCTSNAPPGLLWQSSSSLAEDNDVVASCL